MNAERWERLNDIFHEAAARQAAERDSYVRSACGDDAELRAEVERLLAAHDRAGLFIEAPALATPGAWPELESTREGQRVGPYRIVRELGRGGMGAVYLAERADGLYEQTVALKLIKRGMDTERVLARFRAERQILASLDHPNIARLLDGGTTDGGAPYFAMEYIDGAPIDAWAEARQLDIDQRLQLFLPVCAAVTYAHQRLVVHRDIKPLNILVTSDGIPKLLDFGIARVLQDEDDETSTMTGMRLLTPEYASPEQLEGRHATTVSDVYALGVVLYELLTGRSPYRTRSRALSEIVTAVATTDPDRPSVAVTGGDRVPNGEKLRRRLRGDLDTILLTALRKEPARRYQSVEQFAEDLRRHLAGLPVRARPDTFRYRAGKFVRRNRLPVAAGSVALLALLGGTVATAWQARQARAAQARAEGRFRELRTLAHAVLFDYHDAIKDLRGATPVRERLVRDGLTYLDGLAREKQDDPALQRELAAAYRRMGDVQGGDPSGLGDTQGAIVSYGKALAILEGLLRASPNDGVTKRELAAVALSRASLLWERGDPVGGAREAMRARTVLAPLVANTPGDLAVRLSLGSTLDLLGQIALDQGDARRSERQLREALATLGGAPDSLRARPALRRAVSSAWGHLGDALDDAGDLAGALAAHRQARTIREALSREFPDNADYERIVATSRYYEALVLTEMGRWREALPLFEANVALDPAPFSVLRVGDVLEALGRAREALVRYRDAVGRLEGELKGDSANLYKKLAVAEGRSKLCRTLAVLRDAGAGATCAQAAALLAATPIEPSNAFPRAVFARAWFRVGLAHEAMASGPPSVRAAHRAEARAMFQRSDEIWRDLQGKRLVSRNDAAQPDSVAAALARLTATASPRSPAAPDRSAPPGRS